VTTGRPKVYLVFMGNQWGLEGTNSAGQHTFGGDTANMAPAPEDLLCGPRRQRRDLERRDDPVLRRGTGRGDLVHTGRHPDPLSDRWRPAGARYDSSRSATAEETAGLTGTQPAEAEVAAQSGNTDQASNRDIQSAIVSPTGMNSDGWANSRTGHCAYRDDTRHPTLSGSGAIAGPILAFTDLPYVPDAGPGCGTGQVNIPGTLDGAASAAGHEYAETITDRFPETSPPGGRAYAGRSEACDLCASVSTPAGASPQPGPGHRRGDRPGYLVQPGQRR